MCTCWPAGRAGPFALADPYTVFRLTPLVPPESQRIRLRIVVPAEAEQVVYRINGEPVATRARRAV